MDMHQAFLEWRLHYGAAPGEIESGDLPLRTRVIPVLAQSFAANNRVTLSVPSSVTNYDQLNGKTCTVTAASGTSVTCTLSTAITQNVSIANAALQNPLAYKILEPIRQTNALELDVTWEIRH